jgi:hypothetical protein
VKDLQILSKRIRDPQDGVIVFLEKVCGLPVRKHLGQTTWLKNSNKTINILRPGNRFGKTLITAGKHLHKNFTKLNLWGMYNTTEEWERIQYNTLNFGPGYEQARECLSLAFDIAQGNIHIPPEFQDEYGVTNRSLLKDWFITKEKIGGQLPELEFANGTKLLGRSYDDMGAAFKTKGIAYISGDECGDIREIWNFTNGTLLPRLAQYRNSQIDFIGTVQAEGHDYMRMIEMAEDDMGLSDWEKKGMFYVQKGAMFENPFLDAETVEKIKNIADPVMRQQIIYGEHVETGDKYFGYERAQHAVDNSILLIEKGLPGRRYLLLCDFAGGESSWADFTVLMVLDISEEPYRLVYFNRFKGGDMPIPIQYKLVEDVFTRFSSDGAACKLVIDSSALGGKNALAFLKHLTPIQYNISPTLKAEMLASLKIAFDGGTNEDFKRKIKRLSNGEVIDENPNWGLLRYPMIPALVNEIQSYKLDDKKIRQDCVMTLAMGTHYLQLRRPRRQKFGMRDFDLLQI